MISIDLTGRTALVTGASQGLGAAIATRLHAAGATVLLAYWPDPAGANHAKAVEVAAALGSRATPVPADVRVLSDMQAAVAEALRLTGRIDILVNNAGVIRDRTVKKMTIEEWQSVIDTNLTGVFNGCKAAEPHIADGGRIISLSSISAALGFFGQANYAAAKAGVIGLTRVLSRELARRAITVNAVAPGVVLTDMGKAIPAAEQEKMLTQVPLGRFGTPDDIANAVLFLASDLGTYITGQTIQVNGGWYQA